jgi:hypothetical protein
VYFDRDKGLILWDLAEGKERLRLSTDYGPNRFTPDGRSLISLGKTLQRWDLTTGKPQYRDGEAWGHTGPLDRIEFSPNGREVLSVSADATVRIWDARTGEQLAQLTSQAWSVNSVAHIWGYRNYDTPDVSRNNTLVALLAGGEGWHNNHHADSRSARHGHKWWEIDLTWMAIRLLMLLGLAKNVAENRQLPLGKVTRRHNARSARPQVDNHAVSVHRQDSSFNLGAGN